MKSRQGKTTMGKAELVQHWLDSAAQDLTVAESLFEKKHYAGVFSLLIWL